AQREDAANTRIRVVERIAGPLHIGVAHAGGGDTVAPAKVERQQLDGVLGYAVGGVRVRRGFVNRQRIEVGITMRTAHLPIPAFELGQRARAGNNYAVTRTPV